MDTWLNAYQEFKGVRLNMIVGPSGEFVDENGSSRGLSNVLDRKLIGHLRRQSDVIVTGGNTARNEQYRVPSHCSLAVISETFQIEDPSFISLKNPEQAIPNLKELGFERILLETGPTLSKFFLGADLVDEFCLTVSNGDKISAVKTLAGFNSSLVLAEAFTLEGSLFTVWRRGNE